MGTEGTRPAPLTRPAETSAAQLAKAALRRLATNRLEPTPRTRACLRHEAGEIEIPNDARRALTEASSAQRAGGHNWTRRRKEGIQRVIAGSGSEARRAGTTSQLVKSGRHTAATDFPSFERRLCAGGAGFAKVATDETTHRTRLPPSPSPSESGAVQRSPSFTAAWDRVALRMGAPAERLAQARRRQQRLSADGPLSSAHDDATAAR